MKYLFWLVLAILIVLAVDFVRLAIQRAIWNRRHARMVQEVKRRAVNEQ